MASKKKPETDAVVPYETREMISDLVTQNEDLKAKIDAYLKENEELRGSVAALTQLLEQQTAYARRKHR